MNIKLKNSVLLIGRAGLSMREDAFSAAKAYLNVEVPETHPDFLLLEKDKEKAHIGVDDLEPFMRKVSLMPVYVEKILIIIDGIDYFTEAAQNKVLKVLEDNRNIIVCAISYTDHVLPTIKSRLVPLEYKSLNYEQFSNHELLNGYDDNKKQLLFKLTCGSPGECEKYLDYLDMFQTIKEQVETKMIVSIFKTLHIVNEKDKDCIFKTNMLPDVVCFLYSCFCELFEVCSTGKSSFMQVKAKYTPNQLSKITGLLLHDASICRNAKYSKNEFFLLLASIVEISK